MSLTVPRTMPARKLQTIGRHLLAARWIFAKTMPESPHFYTLRREWERDEDFLEVVQAIRRYGYLEVYKGLRYTMLNVNGWKYWTMGAPLPQTILINRKALTVDGGAR